MSQSITLAELLRDSAYKLTQFKPAQIQGYWRTDGGVEQR